MKYFIETLTSNSKSVELPEEFNYFGKLIGSWKFDYVDHNISCSTKGEWHFSWILEGMAVQDVIILPSRETRTEIPHPLTEYGTTLRVYNPARTLGTLPIAIQEESCALRQENKMI